MFDFKLSLFLQRCTREVMTSHQNSGITIVATSWRLWWICSHFDYDHFDDGKKDLVVCRYARLEIYCCEIQHNSITTTISPSRHTTASLVGRGMTFQTVIRRGE